MTFAQPWALALLGLALPIVAAYLHRFDRRPRPVASTLLWRALRDERAVSRTARPQLRDRASLALLLVALLAATLALAGPRFAGGPAGRVILVLDRSTSMGANDRLARARDAIAGVVRRAAASDELALVAIGGVPSESALLVAPTTRHADLVAAARAVTAAGDHTGDARATEVIAGLCRGAPGAATAIAISDGVGLDLTAAAVAPCALRSIDVVGSVGGRTRPNLGIAALSVRAVDGLGLYDVHLSVASSAGTRRMTELTLAAGGEVLDVLALALPAHGVIERTLRITAPRGDALVATLPPGDALAADDRAEAPLSAAGRVRVLLVTARRASPVADALRLHPRVELVTAAPGALPAGARDLIVLEDPPAGPLPAAPRVVAFGVALEGAPLSLGAAIADRAVLRWDFASPWFEFVDLRDLAIGAARVVVGGRAVAETGAGALIATAAWGERTLIATGFAVDATDLSLRAAFPNLIANLVEWAAPSVPAAAHAPVPRAATESQLRAAPLPGTPLAPTTGGPDPVWLALLAIAALVAEAALWRTRRVLPLALRGALLAALIAAVIGPHRTTTRDDASAMFVIDRSASIDDASLAAAWARAGQLRIGLAPARVGVVQFDARAELAIAPGDAWRPPAARRGPAAQRDGSEVAAAIELALAALPPGGGGSLIVFTDGRTTRADLAAATAAAVARGVAITALPIGAPAKDPAIAAIDLGPEPARTGATLAGEVEVAAGDARGPATLRVSVGGVALPPIPVELAAGTQRVSFRHELPAALPPGPIAVDATLELAPGTADADPANNHASARGVIAPPPRIAILDGDVGGAAPLAAALRAEHMDVTVIPAAVDGPPPSLADLDLVILANAPARAGLNPGVLDDAFGEQLVRWVNAGGGLIVLGGPAALDGSYAANRIADALPVELEPSTPELDSAATVIVILDQSGSMGEEVGGRTKLALAAEGASAVIRLLRSFDRIGVMAVEDKVHWLVPLRTIGSDSAALAARVRGVPVGGDGMFVYTSLVAAQQALARSPTPLRHVILFSDTLDAAEQVKGIDYGFTRGWPSGSANSFAVARAMRQSGTTLSVIGVGAGSDRAFSPATYYDDDDDTDFLRQLAAEGGGRYYRTTDAKQLRGLFVQDARRLLDSRTRDEPVAVEVVAAHPAIAGVDLAHAPKLAGFQELVARPAAQVVLADRERNPLLVRWPYGLGEVAVWASDAGPRWARAWLGWPGYPRLWTQLVRSALRRREGDTAALEATRRGDTTTVRVVRRAEPGAPPPRVRLVARDGQAREVALQLVEPGAYAAQLAVPAADEPVVELLDAAGAVAARRTLTREASTELRDRGPDLAALGGLATATGGALGDAASARLAAPPHPRPTSRALAGLLLLAALLLLPLDAWAHRAARVTRR